MVPHMGRIKQIMLYQICKTSIKMINKKLQQIKTYFLSEETVQNLMYNMLK